MAFLFIAVWGMASISGSDHPPTASNLLEDGMEMHVFLV